MIKSHFVAALEAAEPVLQAVKAQDMHNPTPCKDWNVRDLLNHLYNELAWIPELLAGKTIADVGNSLDGDLVGDDPQRSWRGYSDAATKAVETSEPHIVVHLSYGNVPANAYIHEMAGEVAVHTWDLAQGIGLREFHIPEDTALSIYNQTKDEAPSWRDKGILGPEIAVPADASAEEKLLGMFGRKPSRLL